MKEINIAKVLVSKRKEKGVTQDELAHYMGVSKASVSKWETAQSYPDITFLPQLASYFNISIDDLMGYEPQMEKGDIKRLYHRLSEDFSSKPFDEVLAHCREIIKKYFACFPLLLQMGILILNHSTVLKDAAKTSLLIEEAKALFIRVKNESGDVELSKQAVYLEAGCCLALGNPEEVLELLGGTKTLLFSDEALKASAYQMTGKIDEARSTLQVGIYNHTLSLLGLFSSYLGLCTEDAGKYEEALNRVFAVVEAFEIKRLHPAILMNIYIAAAQGYMILGNTGRALDILGKYAELVTGNIYPLQLHGDDFFDRVDNLLSELDLGVAPPRNEKTIRQSMADIVVNNPVFSALRDEHRFQSIVKRLKNNC